METRVVYYIDDEPTPYLMKIPISPQRVTLMDFKNKLNKVNYNFFFKSTELGIGDVKEEISDNTARLPSQDGCVVSWLRSFTHNSYSKFSNARDSKPFDGASSGDPPKSRERLAELKKDLGNSFYKTQKYKEALELYEEAVKLCPENPSYWGNKAAAYMMMGMYKQAVEAAQNAVKLDCTFIKGFSRLAKCFLSLGDIGSCEQAIRRATDLGGAEAVGTERRALDSLRMLREDAQKHMDVLDYRRIIYCMNRCLEYSPACSRTKLIKAECLAMIGRCHEAQDIVSDLMRFDSSDPDIICVRGLCFYLEENYEQAFKHFQQALRLSPDHTKAQEVYKKAKLLKQKKEDGNNAFRMGRWQEALNLFNEALIVDSTNIVVNAKLYFNKALACAKLNHNREAIDACTASIQLNDNFPNAYRRRALCYTELQLFDEAVKDYERLYQLEKTEENKKMLEQAKLALKESRRKDPYKILGITNTATEDDINRAYRKRGLIEKEVLERERKLREMGEAFATLSDPRKRARYDRGLYVDNDESA